MESEIKKASKLCITILLDKQWHDIYEIHYTYKISPLIILKTIRFLSEKKIITIKDQSVKISDRLDNAQLAFINQLFKTKKPDTLKQIRLALDEDDMLDSEC